MDKKKIIIIISSTIFICAVGWGFYLIRVKSTPLPASEKNVIEQTKKEPSTDQNTNAKASTSAYNTVMNGNIIFNDALKTGNPEKCRELNDNFHQSVCYKALAIQALNKDICKKINEQDKVTDCIDHVYFNAAEADKKLETCNNIVSKELLVSCQANVIDLSEFSIEQCASLDEALKQTCMNYSVFKQVANSKDANICEKLIETESQDECLQMVFGDQNDLRICKSYAGKLNTSCLEIVSAALAYERLDKKICNNITDTEKTESCRNNVDSLLDEDKDGLTNAQEKFYGTNPNKKDSDGDGFTDGDEVERGYNPSGEGKLSSK